MRRGSAIRRLLTATLAAAVIAGVSGGIATWRGLSLEDAARIGASAFSSDARVSFLTEAVTLSEAPQLRLLRGAFTAPEAANENGVTLKLVSPVFETTMDTAGWDPATMLAAAAHILNALETRASTHEIDAITLSDATIVLKSPTGSTAELTALDATIAFGRRAGFTAKGSFAFQGRPATFDASSRPPMPVAAIVGDATIGDDSNASHDSWPFRFHMTSADLNLAIEGPMRAEAGGTRVEHLRLETTDAARLATWLGFGWANPASVAGAGPAVRIDGSALFGDGGVTVEAARVAINDQTGNGAISLHAAGGRPSIDATLAFRALDVAPFLAADRAATAKGIACVPRLATVFPAARVLDVNWRLSTERLQWHGEPIGSAAVSIEARDGKLNVDFAELELGSHRGTLQATSDGAAEPTVTMRGQFRSVDAAPMLSRIFGAAILSGPMASEFDIQGRGATLDMVAAGASGRAHIEARDGRILASLPAMARRIANTAETKATVGWQAIASRTAFSRIAADLRLAGGALIIDRARIDSDGLMAHARGHMGTEASGSLDLIVAVEPASAGNAADVDGAPMIGHALTIRGPFDTPQVSALTAVDKQ